MERSTAARREIRYGSGVDRGAQPRIRLGDQVFALDGDIYPSQNDSSWIPYWRQGRMVAFVSIDGNGESVPTADANRYVWRSVRFP